ncbi:MAG TPA: KUP/HAK/KT family potassium transporter, partial [Chitinophagales bacterium]|nr:KUP/HAK/KT family potassium transporter [Chitinophagales bacterium]
DSKHAHSKLTFAGILITLGIIYGDIGTSPLYVMSAIMGKSPIDKLLVLGGVSCVFWTLTIQTTLKYIILTIQADNKGEGGIFSLYALVRKRAKWLIYPAIIGGCTLLADGIITPAITVSAAVAGLRIYNPGINPLPIIIAIITFLFIFQRAGTRLVGSSFGPIMFIWFSMLGVLGLHKILEHPAILQAVNPVYAFNLLTQHPSGFWLLGAVFLCTTGAEALYSDLGHCGRINIRVSWVFVKTCLLLNYFGQGAWLMRHQGLVLEGNPFYGIMPQWFVIFGIMIATAASVIASQALISGSYTLISEAMRLNIWPKVRTIFPTVQRGQVYIPSVNWFLFTGCVLIVLYFRQSTNMEAAYGLAITITMMMTTILFSTYWYVKHGSWITTAIIGGTFFSVELSFFIANLSKFPHGGYVTLFIAFILFSVMFTWYKARKIKNRYLEFIPVKDYLPTLKELSEDRSVPKYASHLIYLTSADYFTQIEDKVIYSIFNKQPKRADVYWFIHVDVVDEPYRMDYSVDILVPNKVIRIEYKLGFRVAPRLNLFFKRVVENLVKEKRVDIISQYESLRRKHIAGDFRFVVMEKYLSNENELPFYEKIIMDFYFYLKHISMTEEAAFGLDTSNVTVEKFPLILAPPAEINLKEVPSDG